MKTLNAETQRGAEVCGEKEYTSRRESYERKVSEWEDAQRIVNAPMVHVQLAVDPIEGPGQLVGYVVLGRLLDWFPVYVVVAPLPWARRLAHSRVVPDTPLGDLVFAVCHCDASSSALFAPSAARDMRQSVSTSRTRSSATSSASPMADFAL